MKYAATVIAFIIALPSASTAQRSHVAPASAPNTLRMTESNEPGKPLIINLTLLRSDGTPLSNASVYAYQTDARGYYTTRDAMDNANSRLHGYLRTDASGKVTITTIRPGSYPNSRAPQHVHFEVRADGVANRIFEIVFDDDPNVEGDIRRRSEQPGSAFVMCKPEVKGGVDTCTLTDRVSILAPNRRD